MSLLLRNTLVALCHKCENKTTIAHNPMLKDPQELTAYFPL